MACKIEKTHNSIEGGNRSWFIATGDFSSLEARLAAIDTCLNDEGLDPVLHDVYRKGSDHSDLHSMTGWQTFAKTRKAYRVHDDFTGKDWLLDATSRVKVQRGDKEVDCKATELQESDSIIEVL